MKFLTIFLLIATLAIQNNAQTKTVDKLTWKGVSIDESSSNDVIAKFGKPEKEEIGGLGIHYTQGRKFTPKASEKIWKVLKYKEIEQAQKVRFGFDKDDKLVFIHFMPPLRKQPDVQAFLKTYSDTEFKAADGGVDYILSGKQEPGYILAEINRGALIRMYAKKKIENESLDSLQGVVWSLQFVSKSLENKDNTDVLK